MSLLFSSRSCGAYLYDMNESEKLLNDSTSVFLFRTADKACEFITLTDISRNLYFFPVLRTSVTMKIADFMYIMCHGDRYLGIAFPMFDISLFYLLITVIVFTFF